MYNMVVHVLRFLFCISPARQLKVNPYTLTPCLSTGLRGTPVPMVFLTYYSLVLLVDPDSFYRT